MWLTRSQRRSLVYAVSTAFPFVEVPAELHAVFGKPYRGTRIYRKIGAEEEIKYWYEVMTDRFGDVVSPGGASMFAPVSRAAVHKRMHEGKLTCFLFDITHRKRTLFGSNTNVRELAVAMIPVSECKAWGAEIEQRAIDKGIVTREELEGDKPDWNEFSLEPDSKWEKQKLRKDREAKP